MLNVTRTQIQIKANPTTQAMRRKPVHSVRSSLHSQAFSTTRKGSTAFRSAGSTTSRATLALPPVAPVPQRCRSRIKIMSIIGKVKGMPDQ